MLRLKGWLNDHMYIFTNTIGASVNKHNNNISIIKIIDTKIISCFIIAVFMINSQN